MTLALGSGSALPGGTVALNLTMNATGAAPAALQWTFRYSSADIVSVQAVEGAAATAPGADKTLNCAAGAGTYTCLLAGMNTNAIGNGVVATATFRLSAAPSTTSIPIQVTNPVVASPAGNALTTSATGGTIAVTVPVTVVPTGLSCAPSSFTAAGLSACTVTLNTAAPAGGLTVALVDNSASVTAPPSVAVAAGATTAAFTATVSAVTTDATARITATLNGTSASATLSLVAPAALSALSCNPATLAAGAASTCTVTLTKAAPSGGFAVSLSDNSSSLSVPSSVTVAANSATATFTATAGTPSTQQSVIVTATANAVSRTAAITVQAQLRVSALSCTPSSFTAAGSASCAVTLNTAAPTGGVSVALASSSPSVTVPASVNVAAGSTTAAFSAVVAAASSNGTAQLTAALNGTTASATLSLTAQAALAALTCSPTTLAAGGSSSCTVTVTAPAPAGGLTVAVSASSSVLTAPASVTVDAGVTSAAFSVVAGATSTTQNVTLTATASGTAKTAGLTVQGAAAGSAQSIWPASAVPGRPYQSDPGSVEVGVRFRSDVAGYVLGVRFYKGGQNTGSHSGSLWSASGALLATGSFVNETADGWQEMRFATPVAIAANTTYVASYHTRTGYAWDPYYFNAQGVDNAPLHALKSGVDGNNGVYTYGSDPCFPVSSADSNYWVDVVFSPTAAGPPVSAQSIWPAAATPSRPYQSDPGSVEVGVKFRSDVAGYVLGVRFYKGGQNTGSHSGSLWSAAGALLATGSFVNETADGWQEMRFATPVAIAANTTYVASYHSRTGYAWDPNYFNAQGVDNAPLHALKSGVDGKNGLYTYGSDPCFPVSSAGSNYWVDVVFSATAADLPPPAQSIWPASTVPSRPYQSDPTSVELGIKFRSDVAGYIRGIRFYKGAQNSGPHSGSLWSAAGALLATGSFVNETADGWQEMRFATPVAIAANTTYVASYHSRTGYAWDPYYFNAQGVDNAPLHALKSGVDGKNGVYTYGSDPCFPVSSAGSNYWVDVVFSPAAP